VTASPFLVLTKKVTSRRTTQFKCRDFRPPIAAASPQCRDASPPGPAALRRLSWCNLAGGSPSALIVCSLCVNLFCLGKPARKPIAKALNRSHHAAKATKQDEFYTQLSDIEKKLKHYTKHFKGKTVFCNCDDPRVSNFFHYFSHNFEKLKLKKLITTCYKNDSADLFSTHTAERGKYLVYEGDKDGDCTPGPDETHIHDLKGDGDLRSEECIALFKQADIVVGVRWVVAKSVWI
jgi:hypothetical protein